jgi:ABC-2 type transport system ATP-binding protein
VAIIDRGRVVRQGRMADLVSGTLEAEVHVDRASPELLAALETRWHVARPAPPAGWGRSTVDVLRIPLEDVDELPAVADTVLRSGTRLHALIPQHTTLEDLFVQSVGSRES